MLALSFCLSYIDLTYGQRYYRRLGLLVFQGQSLSLHSIISLRKKVISFDLKRKSCIRISTISPRARNLAKGHGGSARLEIIMCINRSNCDC